jgi:hypothetical protein
MTVVRELARYKLDLVGVQVRRDKGGTARAGDLTFLLWYKREYSQSVKTTYISKVTGFG